MEHINAEILRAIADGKKVQYRKCHPLGWEPFQNADTVLCWKLLKGGSPVEWRIAPETIMIGECEVPEPCWEPLRTGQKFWIVSPFTGPQRFIWDGSKACHDALESGFVHLTEEAAEKHYEAFKNLLGKKS